jgi:TetR/AcrR family transcriptional regulator
MELKNPRRRTRDPDQTRRDLIDAAIAEFSEKGFSGGRVDDIARAPPSA